MKVVIIGNGPAGYFAAKKLISLDSVISVSLIDKDSIPLYAKIRLPEFIAGKINEDKLFLVKADDYEKSGIEYHPSETVIKINREYRKVETLSGKKFSYDKLIFALGATPLLPPVKGINQKDIFTLRTLEDARQILERLKSADSATVIGGGLLGLELAYVLKDKGLKVSVLEYFPRLLPKNLNEAESRLLLEKLKDTGVVFYLGRNPEAIISDGKSLSIKTDRNNSIKSDMILVSAGITPNTKLASESGLKVHHGIVVNDLLQTSDENIFAAGDCAEINGVIQGLWVAAKEQGEAAADILTGRLKSYKPSTFIPSLKVSNIQLKDIRTEASALNLK